MSESTQPREWICTLMWERDGIGAKCPHPPQVWAVSPLSGYSSSLGGIFLSVSWQFLSYPSFFHFYSWRKKKKKVFPFLSSVEKNRYPSTPLSIFFFPSPRLSSVRGRENGICRTRTLSLSLLVNPPSSPPFTFSLVLHWDNLASGVSKRDMIGEK